ncbi:biotin--[acetyl-CoA-carboxylase] ligase [Methanococcus maripaludis]|uniref:Biotin--acetyl-CoA-carboxylase ligase n=1 Tax=Methanococcus maripaludis (strain C7 / ATCC BAA-1331) TaxID=426368 RepID=A6VIA8_METM7|nr:biotin--[acetyl-CoA-carboxylase] ligase [Methanococcus maripaludis]
MSLKITSVVRVDFEIISYKTINSTNLYAYDLGKLGKRNKIVVSEIQTHGKGRLDRSWFSNKGGLYFSVLMDIKDVGKLEKINFLGSLSVVETLKEFSDKKFEIKWPNDVLFENKKICGILTELNVSSGYLVLGIGLNINNTIDSEIKEIGTSLKEIENLEFNVDLILNKFIEIFTKNLKIDDELLLERYKKYSKTMFKNVNLIILEKTVTGKVVDISYNGIHINTGNYVEVFNAGDCIHLR